MTALKGVLSIAQAVRACEGRAEVVSLDFTQREAGSNLLDDPFKNRIFTPSVAAP
jgi:hypothetical protein